MDSWVGKIPCRKVRLPTAVFLGFSCGSAGKECACNAGDPSWIPGLGRSRGEGNSYPLQYSCLENSMDCVVHGVTESDMTRGFHFHFLLHWQADSLPLSHQEAKGYLMFLQNPICKCL